MERGDESDLPYPWRSRTVVAEPGVILISTRGGREVSPSSELGVRLGGRVGLSGGKSHVQRLGPLEPLCLGTSEQRS